MLLRRNCGQMYKRAWLHWVALRMVIRTSHFFLSLVFPFLSPSSLPPSLPSFLPFPFPFVSFLSTLSSRAFCPSAYNLLTGPRTPSGYHAVRLGPQGLRGWCSLLDGPLTVITERAGISIAVFVWSEFSAVTLCPRYWICLPQCIPQTIWITIHIGILKRLWKLKQCGAK